MNIRPLYVLFFVTLLFASCSDTTSDKHVLIGTWQSLWDEDMTLQLHFDDPHHFRTTLDRTGQVHTNYGWYTVEDNGVFLLKDSIDLPLPVCNYTDTGKYHIQVVKDTLSFVKIADTCERRGLALQLAKFVKVR